MHPDKHALDQLNTEVTVPVRGIRLHQDYRRSIPDHELVTVPVRGIRLHL